MTTATEALADLATCANLEDRPRAAALYSLAGTLAELAGELAIADRDAVDTDEAADVIERIDRVGLDCFRVSYHLEHVGGRG